MTGKHCRLSQRRTESFSLYLLAIFPLSAVGLVIKTKTMDIRCTGISAGLVALTEEQSGRLRFYLLLRSM